MLLSASYHGVVGNLCNFPLFNQTGVWGEKQNEKLKKFVFSIVSQTSSSFDFSRWYSQTLRVFFTPLHGRKMSSLKDSAEAQLDLV